MQLKIRITFPNKCNVDTEHNVLQFVDCALSEGVTLRRYISPFQ